jgi:hypothetical protein
MRLPLGTAMVAVTQFSEKVDSCGFENYTVSCFRITVGRSAVGLVRIN